MTPSSTPLTDREVYTVSKADIGSQAVNPALCRAMERELQQLRHPRINQVAQLVVPLLSVPGLYLQNLPAGHPWVLYGYALLLAAQPIWIVETFRHRMWGMFSMAWLYTGAWSMGLINHLGG